MIAQFRDLMRAHAETYRRLWGLSLDIAHGVARDPETEVSHTLRPLKEHEARYPVRFKDMPFIGWALSMLGYAVNLLSRLALVPGLGWGPKWPELNIPKCWDRRG